MAEIGRGLDVALVPIWGWGPSAGRGHLDPRRAAEALRLLRPLLTVPIHWGTYAPLGVGRLQKAVLADPVAAFRRRAEELAPEVAVRSLGLGETLRLDEITGDDPDQTGRWLPLQKPRLQTRRRRDQVTTSTMA